MNQANNIIKFLRFSAKLKKQERTIKLSWKRQESVADHSWHLGLMTLIVSPYLKDKIDLCKTLKMVLIHDLVEAEIGDIPHGVTHNNKNYKNKKTQLEEKEIRKIQKVIGEKLGQEIYELWNEFEELKTPEAKFIKALDSLEANFQSTLFNVSYWDDFYYKIALDKAKPYCQHEKILQKLNQLITKNMEKRITRAGYDIRKVKAGYYDKEHKPSVKKYLINLKIQKLLQKFSKELPHFSDGRIDYSGSDIAAVITVFVKYKNKILLLKRSDKVRAYKSKWNTIAGYLDEPEKSIKEKVYEELEEELGIKRSNIKNLKIAGQYKIYDPEIDRTWLTYPTLVELIKKPEIKLNWEHSDYKWIKPDEIKNFDCVYRLKESLLNITKEKNEK